MSYVCSRYNYPLTTNESCYLYNLLSTSIVELDEKIYEDVTSGSLSNLSDDIIEYLYSQGFIVEAGTNEIHQYEYYYNHARFEETFDKLKVTILPTYSCNLACPYCFEGENKDHHFMTINQARSIVDFIKKEAMAKPIREVFVSFFGGEPLLCKDIIEFVCEEISAFSSKQEIEVVYDITTNLTLLDESFVDVIKKHKVFVQVTLDGKKESHDARRCYRNGKGTYDIIVKKLDLLLKSGVKDLVSIRINIDKNNINDAEDVLKFALKYAGHVYFGFIKEYTNYNDDYQSKCISKDCFFNYDISIIHDIYRKLGIATPVEFGKRAPCTINSENCYIVDCRLDVYKCEILQDHQECKVGTITAQGEFVPNKNFYHQMNINPALYEKCHECFLLPLCGGGCPGEKYINDASVDGNLHKPDCNTSEESLKAYLIDYINNNGE